MGGAQSIILSLIRSLPRDRFRILVAPWQAGIEADDVFADAAAAAGATLTGPIRWQGWRSLRAAQDRIAALIAEHRVDMVHCHDNVSNTLVGLARGRFALPAVASAYGWWDMNLKLRLLYAFERRFALTRFDRVYTVGHDMAGKLRAAGVRPERIDVIHTGLDLDVWAPRGTRAAVRAGFGIPPGAVVVGALGRVSREKGLDHLLAAMTMLRPEFPDLTALLVGRGPDLDRIRGLAQAAGLGDRVVMPGFFADGAAALEAMDIAVMPSVLAEGFPTAAIEAQALGLPVVASDIGGTRETLVPGQTGTLVPPGDPAALAAALRPLLADPALRARTGAAARARIAAGFALPQMLDRIGAFYEAGYRQAR
jgi:glycosyltransferase involved in cell wall biosynthesis